MDEQNLQSKSFVKNFPTVLAYPLLGVILILFLFLDRFAIGAGAGFLSRGFDFWDTSTFFRWIWLLLSLALIASFFYAKYIPNRIVLTLLATLSFINMFLLKPSFDLLADANDSLFSFHPVWPAYLSLFLMIALLVLDYLQSKSRGIKFFSQEFAYVQSNFPQQRVDHVKDEFSQKYKQNQEDHKQRENFENQFSVAPPLAKEGPEDYTSSPPVDIENPESATGNPTPLQSNGKEVE